MTDRQRGLRLGGALLVLVGGAVHLRLLVDGYGTDGIARSFAANAIAAALIGGYLVLRRDVLGPLAGIVLSLASLVALGLVRTGDGLFGFREDGLQPMPELALAVGAEVLGAIALVGLLLSRRRSTTGSPDPTPVVAVADEPNRPARERPLVAPGRG